MNHVNNEVRAHYQALSNNQDFQTTSKDTSFRTVLDPYGELIPAAAKHHHLILSALNKEEGVHLLHTFLKVTTEPGDQKKKAHAVFYFYVGSDVCSHTDIIHGGLQSTILDDTMGYAGFHGLRSGSGVTSELHVQFRKPCYSNQIIRVDTESKGTMTKNGRSCVTTEGSIKSIAEVTKQTHHPDGKVEVRKIEAGTKLAIGSATYVEMPSATHGPHSDPMGVKANF